MVEGVTSGILELSDFYNGHDPYVIRSFDAKVCPVWISSPELLTRQGLGRRETPNAAILANILLSVGGASGTSGSLVGLNV